MKKIILNEGILKLQDIEDGLEEGEEIEVEIGGKAQKVKVQKTELFKSEVIRVFIHRPNSFEFNGEKGEKFKFYYYSEEDAVKKLNSIGNILKLKKTIIV